MTPECGEKTRYVLVCGYRYFITLDLCQCTVPICALCSRRAIKIGKNHRPDPLARPQGQIESWGLKIFWGQQQQNSGYQVRYLKNNVIIVDRTRVRIGNNPILCGLVARMQIPSKS